MEMTAAQPGQISSMSRSLGLKPIWREFIFWCSQQEERNHIGWVGLSITLMTVIFFPLTMMSVLLHGASFSLIMLAMVPLNLVFITNLAASSTKYTIPFLLVGIFADLMIVGASFVLN